jgi:cytochrome c1
VAALLTLSLLLSACDLDTSGSGEPALTVPNGDAGRGSDRIGFYGCGACHVIPGIKRADGTVGPPLTAFGKRDYIAGEALNTPDNLVQWIMDPQSIEPGTAMPNMSVTQQDARDIAAYLYTLMQGN